MSNLYPTHQRHYEALHTKIGMWLTLKVSDVYIQWNINKCSDMEYHIYTYTYIYTYIYIYTYMSFMSFMISKYHENCNAISSFTVNICHVTLNNFICSAAHCFCQFVMVFLDSLPSFFRDATDKEQSQLVEFPVEDSIFECNIQKSVPRSLQLKKYCVVLKNGNLQLRFEVSNPDTSRIQSITSDTLPSLELS